MLHDNATPPPHPLAEKASLEALHCFAFVSQLDAPVLHKAFTTVGELLLECVAELDRLHAAERSCYCRRMQDLGRQLEERLANSLPKP